MSLFKIKKEGNNFLQQLGHGKATRYIERSTYFAGIISDRQPPSRLSCVFVSFVVRPIVCRSSCPASFPGMLTIQFCIIPQ
jgi:hypothetical protein